MPNRVAHIGPTYHPRTKPCNPRCRSNRRLIDRLIGRLSQMLPIYPGFGLGGLTRDRFYPDSGQLAKMMFAQIARAEMAKVRASPAARVSRN